MDRVKSKFFANISHEFRTPLPLILGPLAKLKKDTKDPEDLRRLDLMQQNATKLLTHVNQLLELSKLDAGASNLKFTTQDIVSYTKGITMTFESLAEEKNINLKFSANKASILTSFDKDSIDKIMVNLLSNAFKFSHKSGEISVNVEESTTSNGKHDKRSVVITVKDNGIGFDEHLGNQIFERYKHTESDLQASSGIGLALVKELVESHHGKIEATSSKGIGSTFTITLPMELNENSKVSFDEIQASQINIHLSKTENSINNGDSFEMLETINPEKESVLLIEDNPDVRNFIREVVGESFIVTESENGIEGIKMAEESLPDLIISDVMMPGMDGFEVTSKLKQSEKTSHIPVILLTAKADQESRIEGLNQEADDYITKPFDSSELLARINNLINSRKKLREKFSHSQVIKPGEINITSVDEKFLNKVINIVEENMDNESLNVELLGSLVNMSRSQINRKMQALTGQSPNRFIRNMRLARAMDLLKNNAGSVADVAYMTGFSSPNYFNKCFKEQFGFAPGEVRKQVMD